MQVSRLLCYTGYVNCLDNLKEKVVGTCEMKLGAEVLSCLKLLEQGSIAAALAETVEGNSQFT